MYIVELLECKHRIIIPGLGGWKLQVELLLFLAFLCKIRDDPCLHTMPIYNVSMKEVRWRAASPDTFMAMLKIEGNFSRLRARPAHFVGHLHTKRGDEISLPERIRSKRRLTPYVAGRLQVGVADG